jgi:hypothetical protein
VFMCYGSLRRNIHRLFGRTAKDLNARPSPRPLTGLAPNTPPVECLGPKRGDTCFAPSTGMGRCLYSQTSKQALVLVWYAGQGHQKAACRRPHKSRHRTCLRKTSSGLEPLGPSCADLFGLTSVSCSTFEGSKEEKAGLYKT